MLKLPRASRLIAGICVLAAASSSMVFADDTSDALKALQAAIEKESATAKSASPASRSDEEGYPRGREMSAMFLAQIRSALASGEIRQLEELLNQLPVYMKSEQVRSAADKLRAAIAADRSAKDAALAQQIEQALAGASKAVKAAQKPADLDESIRELGRFQEQQRYDERYYSKSRVGMEKLRSARQFVIRWQDYLSNVATGSTQEALQNLRNLASDSVSADLLPRSEILARIAEYSKPKPTPTPASAPAATGEQPNSGAATASAPAPLKPIPPEQQLHDILEKTKSLEEIPNTILAIEEVQRQAGRTPNAWNDPLTAAINELNTLLQGYREYKAGFPSQFDVRLRQGNTGASSYANEAYTNAFPLRAQLIKLLAIQFIKAGDDLKPGTDEPLDKYMDRVLETAKQKFDIPLMKRVLEFQDKLTGRGSSASCLQTLFAAQNQEAANQFVPAVVSYQNALKSGGEIVPAKGVGEKLEAIKKAHPEEYEQGMKWFLTPIQNVQLMNSNFAFPPGKPGAGPTTSKPAQATPDPAAPARP